MRGTSIIWMNYVAIAALSRPTSSSTWPPCITMHWRRSPVTATASFTKGTARCCRLNLRCLARSSIATPSSPCARTSPQRSPWDPNPLLIRRPATELRHAQRRRRCVGLVVWPDHALDKRRTAADHDGRKLLLAHHPHEIRRGLAAGRRSVVAAEIVAQRRQVRTHLDRSSVVRGPHTLGRTILLQRQPVRLPRIPVFL